MAYAGPEVATINAVRRPELRPGQLRVVVAITEVEAGNVCGKIVLTY